MHPEEPLVSLLSITFANSASGIFVQELANHGLGDRMNDSRVRRHTVSASWLDTLARRIGHAGARCTVQERIMI